MDGGHRKPIPLNAVGDYLSRSGKVIKAANDATRTGSGYNQSGGSYGKSGGAVSGIDKYL